MCGKATASTETMRPTQDDGSGVGAASGASASTGPGPNVQTTGAQQYADAMPSRSTPVSTAQYMEHTVPPRPFLAQFSNQQGFAQPPAFGGQEDGFQRQQCVTQDPNVAPAHGPVPRPPASWMGPTPMQLRPDWPGGQQVPSGCPCGQ